MKTSKKISILTILIIILTLFAALTGLLSKSIHNYPDMVSVYGEKIKLYQTGLYAKDSVSMASQALAQDFITLIIGIPLLIVSLYLINKKNSIRGWFLITGTFAYFLYTYLSYSVLLIYNHLYLIYVILTALSFYAFIISISFLHSFDTDTLFSKKYPVKQLSIFLLIIGLSLGCMWLGRILPTLTNDTAPVGLEHYSTLVIQSLDLGFIIPAAFVSSYLLHNKQSWGYLLSAVLVMKMMTMGSAVSAMGFNMKLHGVKMGIADLIVFPILVLINVFFLYKMLAAMNSTSLTEKA